MSAEAAVARKALEQVLVRSPLAAPRLLRALRLSRPAADPE
jgi:hypothetical protein